MRAIIVDDEPLMVRKFTRLAEGLPGLNLVGQFNSADEALEFTRDNEVELAFLDVEMPGMNGIELAGGLREIRDDMMIVFVTAHEEYILESNRIGADYYIVKPYTAEVLRATMEKLRLLARRQDKNVYIQTFGRFLVRKDGRPITLTGKAKEILALIVTRRGKEISNEEIYCTVWENRPYDNGSMSVYYNALKRLKLALEKEDLGKLLVSTAHGQTVNTDLFDCDYYAWKDKLMDPDNPFEGEFLTEYSWSEYLLAEITG